MMCPVPLVTTDKILLGHGSGGKLSAELIDSIFLPAFHNPVLARLDDQGVVTINGAKLAVTTDSFVVKPLFFRGGDIGSLAVHGTVNDLAMGGARPLFLTVAFILEEGLPLETLRRVVDSLAAAARAAGVQIITGDTKVVEKGSGDGIFINTTGIGLVPEGVELSASAARPGDCVILSGSDRRTRHGHSLRARRPGVRNRARKRLRRAPHAGGRHARRRRPDSHAARPHARRRLQHVERNRQAIRRRNRDRGERHSGS
jgi:hydrogenase expression/formation protein HypE